MDSKRKHEIKMHLHAQACEDSCAVGHIARQLVVWLEQHSATGYAPQCGGYRWETRNSKFIPKDIGDMRASGIKLFNLKWNSHNREFQKIPAGPSLARSLLKGSS